MEKPTEKAPRPGYKFDHVNCRIIVTHEFHQKANLLDSEEFKTLQKLRKTLPNYTVEFAPTHRKTSAKSHIKLAQMTQYINKQPNAESILADLDKVRYPADCNNAAPFSVVKKWFFARFPNYGRITAFDEKGHIIDTAA
jgi:hypothetical protein